MNTPEDVILYEDTATKLYEERVNDLNGYLTEAISEASDEWKARLAELAIKWAETPLPAAEEIEKTVGSLVLQRICLYCSPSGSEVREAMYGE